MKNKGKIASTIIKALQEVKLHKEGKIKLNTLNNFLAKN